MKVIFMFMSGCFLYCTAYLNFNSPVQDQNQKKDIQTESKKQSFKATFQDSAVNTIEVVKKSLKTENKDVFEAYIERFTKVALIEQEKYGIPASITMAQGIMESNAGRSKMAQRDNNHFGIKCYSKCIGCRCANYADDDIYDMFRIFDSAWESYREHSKVLLRERYKSCFKNRDYKHWANELQRCGYATSKKYASGLIRVIEYYKLYKLDK